MFLEKFHMKYLKYICPTWYLKKNSKVDFSFPFRRESIKILSWARDLHPNWKLDYLLSLNLWGKGRHKESQGLLSNIEEKSNNPIFYLEEYFS